MHDKLQKTLRVVMALPALLFVLMGLRWLLDPTGIAPEFGMVMMSGLGLSSQIGDLSAFFLTAGLCALAGLVTKTRSWFYAPVILLALTAFGRLIAFFLHHAEFAGQMIAIEVAVALLWFYGSVFVSDKKSQQ